MSDPNQQLGETGLQQAMIRLKGSLTQSGCAGGEPLVALAEVLTWAYSLEEWHRARLQGMGRDYYSARDTAPEGQVAAGLIYARGLVAHQLALVGSLVTRSSQPGVPSAQLGVVQLGVGNTDEWRWKRLQDLPRPDKPEKHGRDQLYQAHLAGRPLLEPLQAVERFFVTTAKTL
jgi:hypothetical protein